MSHAEEVRQQEGIHRLRRSMHETSKVKANDAAMYQEGVGFLQSEAAEDDRAKLKYGTDRWTRQSSQQAAEQLYKQVTEIEGYLKSAQSSDELVKGKLRDCEEILQILSGTDRDLEEYVPSSRRAAMPPNVERAAGTLRTYLNEVSRLEIRRNRLIEKLRDKAKADDISKTLPTFPYCQHTKCATDTSILAETARLERDFPMQKIEPAQFENLFEQRLARYDPDRQSVLDFRVELESLSTQIKEANATFTSARRGDSSTKEREQALQRLENGYFKYKEIVSNLNTGRKFYNDLANNVSRFKVECQQFGYERRTEAAHFESDLSNAISSLNLSQTHNLQDQKQRETMRSHYNEVAPAAEPLMAPTPTRAAVMPPPVTSSPGIWKPEMGISFDRGAGAPQAQRNGNDMHNPPYPNTKGGRGGQWDPSRGLKFN